MNFSVIELKSNSTSLTDEIDYNMTNGRDISEAEERVYRFQMIKVIVLVTVMTLILITSCKSMLNVLGRYVTK